MIQVIVFIRVYTTKKNNETVAQGCFSLRNHPFRPRKARQARHAVAQRGLNNTLLVSFVSIT
ncbi:hypothetical protein PSP6_60150 [Paraburkholderia tropica]|nr:hypothetical protein PSP6_60150 [Paraburkholderia tropica]